MRIALVVPGFSADSADWCIPVVTDVVKVLAREHDVHVFALRYPNHRGVYEVHGTRVHAMAGGEAAGARRATLLGGALRVLAAEHRRRPFEVIHGLWADEPGALAALAGRVIRVPSVVSVMGGELTSLPDIGYGGRLSRANRMLTGIAMSLAGHVTAGSNMALDNVRRTYPLLRDRRLERLTWGIDPILFEGKCPPAQLEGALRILAVGSLVPVKDHRTLIDAAGLLRPHLPGLHLHLVGEGPERGALAARARAQGLGDVVTLHGQVRREDLGRYYRAAHVLAVPSLHELQPAVALEAALCGTSVIGTPVGLIPELASAVTPAGAAGAIADALRRFAADGAARARAAEAARLVRERYLARHTASALTELYATMKAERGGRQTGIVTKRVWAGEDRRQRAVAPSGPAELVERHD